jgi:hypothetical protein
VRLSVDEADPQSQASVPVARARLHLLTGRFQAAYDDVLSVDEAQRFPDHLSAAMVAAAMLRDIDRLEVVAEGLRTSPARGRMLGSLRNAVSGALAALRGHTTEAVADFSRALVFRYLRLDRANLQALFATLVGREVPEARKASDAAFEVFTEVGATAYLDLYAAGMPPAEERQATGS